MSGYRPAYTIEEDNKILKVIIATEAFYVLRTNGFWIDLENTNLLDRTWQSMKQRFDKHILPNIMNQQYDLTLLNKRRIEIGFWQSSNDFVAQDVFFDNADSDSS